MIAATTVPSGRKICRDDDCNGATASLSHLRCRPHPHSALLALQSATPSIMRHANGRDLVRPKTCGRGCVGCWRMVPGRCAGFLRIAFAFKECGGKDYKNNNQPDKITP
jgi:hypothetical protein